MNWTRTVVKNEIAVPELDGMRGEQRGEGGGVGEEENGRRELSSVDEGGEIVMHDIFY